MPRKVLFASDTSGHTAGYQTVLAGLRDGGFEVVSIGHAEPEHVAETALQEGVDAVAYRVMDRDAAVLGKSLLRGRDERDRRSRPLSSVCSFWSKKPARGGSSHTCTWSAPSWPT
jgi:methylmalonyl-CoA mutase cobalamin-binding subunit